VVFSTGLKPAEILEVQGWLSQVESGVYLAQPSYDQRHGLESARYVAEVQPMRRDLIRAALLHDIGKRRAGLGFIRRSLVSAYTKLGGVPGGRWRSYIDHGPGAAIELEALGAEPVVVDFARHHHGQRPESISQEDWTILQEADRR
jgi:putative nucleotidyltransferase with HDIG domain